MLKQIARLGVAIAMVAASLLLAACDRSLHADGGIGQASTRSEIAKDTAPGRRVAVTHDFHLEMPAEQVESLQQRHLAECAKVRCTVLKTSTRRSDGGYASASSSLRISPEDYPALAALITAPPITVVSHSETAEDKTLPMLDVEKRLDGKTALRDRLTAMLHDPAPKTAADLLAIEKDLSDVQTEIETATAERDYLRTVTETVTVEISYESPHIRSHEADFTEISDALAEVGRTFVRSVAVLIAFVAAAVPWLPLIALVVWGIRRLRRRSRAARPPETPH